MLSCVGQPLSSRAGVPLSRCAGCCLPVMGQPQGSRLNGAASRCASQRRCGVLLRPRGLSRRSYASQIQRFAAKPSFSSRKRNRPTLVAECFTSPLCVSHLAIQGCKARRKSARTDGAPPSRPRPRTEVNTWAGTEVSGASDNQAHANEQGTPTTPSPQKEPVGERNTPN